MARSARKTRRVAIMLDLQWPYRRHVDVFLGVDRYARECGRWDMVIDEFPQQALARYDGVVARATPALVRKARSAGVPVVNVWHNAPVRGLPGVYPDFAAAGRQAAEHLLELGLRRFVCVFFPANRTHQAMEQAFRSAIEAAGHGCQANRAETDQPARDEATWQRSQALLARWARTWEPPIGVFVAFNGCDARRVSQACLQQGLRIPDDVALVVADDDLPICLQPLPTLTGIDLGYERAGCEAARLLDQLMSGKAAPPEPILVPGGGIHARQSTDCFATDDATVSAALRFIARRLAKPLSVDEVATEVGASRRTLERKFQRFAQRSVFGEVRRLRIERAKRLLIDTDLPIKQVARACGFDSHLSLYQVFVREAGSSPSRFRKANGGKIGQTPTPPASPCC